MKAKCDFYVYRKVSRKDGSKVLKLIFKFSLVAEVLSDEQSVMDASFDISYDSSEYYVERLYSTM